MAWFILFLSGLLEIVWAWYMKQSDGFTKLWPSIWTMVSMGAGIALLSVAMKSLPLGTAYGVWTGIGVVGTFIVGIVFLGESAGVMRVASACLIVAGLVGLKLTASE